MNYIKEPHPHRPGGFHLTFPNGHIWSCVDLSGPHSEGGLRQEDIGIIYDGLGGRFEAMCFNADVEEDQFREHSFEELFEAVENYETLLKANMRHWWNL